MKMSSDPKNWPLVRRIWSGNVSFPAVVDEKGEEKYRFPRLTRAVRKIARMLDA